MLQQQNVQQAHRAKKWSVPNERAVDFRPARRCSSCARETGCRRGPCCEKTSSFWLKREKQQQRQSTLPSSLRRAKTCGNGVKKRTTPFRTVLGVFVFAWRHRSASIIEVIKVAVRFFFGRARASKKHFGRPRPFRIQRPRATSGRNRSASTRPWCF